MNLLILNDSVKEKIQKVKKYAESYPLSHADLQRYSNPENIIIDLSRFYVYANIGYRFTYTVEEQQTAEGVFVMMRHLSASVRKGDTILPAHPEAVRLIMPEFGFTQNLEECILALTDDDTIINILEEIK